MLLKVMSVENYCTLRGLTSSLVGLWKNRVYKYTTVLQQSCTTSAFTQDCLLALSLEGVQKGTVGTEQKENVILSGMDVYNYHNPCDDDVFLKVAAHLWETKLNTQLGPVLEVILECMVALRPDTMY